MFIAIKYVYPNEGEVHARRMSFCEESIDGI